MYEGPRPWRALKVINLIELGLEGKQETSSSVPQSPNVWLSTISLSLCRVSSSWVRKQVITLSLSTCSEISADCCLPRCHVTSQLLHGSWLSESTINWFCKLKCPSNSQSIALCQNVIDSPSFCLLLGTDPLDFIVVSDVVKLVFYYLRGRIIVNLRWGLWIWVRKEEYLLLLGPIT